MNRRCVRAWCSVARHGSKHDLYTTRGGMAKHVLSGPMLGINMYGTPAYTTDTKKWRCGKCQELFSENVSQDFHEDKVHPDFSNPYVASWHKNGCRGLSPYD